MLLYLQVMSQFVQNGSTCKELLVRRNKVHNFDLKFQIEFLFKVFMHTEADLIRIWFVVIVNVNI